MKNEVKLGLVKKGLAKRLRPSKEFKLWNSFRDLKIKSIQIQYTNSSVTLEHTWSKKHAGQEPALCS